MDKSTHKTASQMLHNELAASDMSVEIATLRVQMNHLESRNTLLHEEVLRLRAKVEDYGTRIGDASATLFDWDGYYDPKTGNGNVQELAQLIEEVYATLQGKSWRDPNQEKPQ